MIKMHNLQDLVLSIVYLTLLCIFRFPAVQDLWFLKLSTIFKWFKKFCPLTKATEILRPKTCAQNLVTIYPSVWSLSRSQTHSQKNEFCLLLLS